MTRYRIVCADSERHTVEHRDRHWAEQHARDVDVAFTCGPHRVEEVPG